MAKLPVNANNGEASAQAELERLRAENAALKAQSARAVSLKVSAKGGVSLYGVGRWPVTLYKEQWETVLGHADELQKFLVDNASKLKTRGVDDNGAAA